MASHINKAGCDTATDDDVCVFVNAARDGKTQRIADDLKRFGSNFANANLGGTTGLMLAAFHGHTGVMKLLLENGADTEARNRDDDTALTWALYGKKPDAAILLLDYGANVDVVNSMGETPFTYAEKLGRQDIIAWMKTSTPRNIERIVEAGVQQPLPVHKPLRLRR
ncbi:MAG: ankyrin repeat domain-containing protein [Alphaproteobacteria bacterium]